MAVFNRAKGVEGFSRTFGSLNLMLEMLKDHAPFCYFHCLMFLVYVSLLLGSRNLLLHHLLSHLPFCSMFVIQKFSSKANIIYTASLWQKYSSSLVLLPGINFFHCLEVPYLKIVGSKLECQS